MPRYRIDWSYDKDCEKYIKAISHQNFEASSFEDAFDRFIKSSGYEDASFEKIRITLIPEKPKEVIFIKEGWTIHA